MSSNPLLRAVVLFMLPFLILWGLYVQFHGDYSPGGGFQAGMILATALILYAMVFGDEVALRTMPLPIVEFWGILGVLIYVGTGLLTIFLGSDFLAYNVLSSTPAEGQVIGIFTVEFGVALTVSSSMLVIYFAFSRIIKNDS